MINNFFKTIHNKYSKFFSFIFFLRYLFLIFLIFITLFLNIPKFFDYGTRLEIIQSHIIDTYNFKIDGFEKIKFKALPLPRLELKNATVSLNNTPVKLKVNDLKIFPEFFSIYNYNNFRINKIILKNSDVFWRPRYLIILHKTYLNKKKAFS